MARKEEEEELERRRKEWEQEKFYCEPCKKSFKSDKQCDNHFKSKKHKQNVVKWERENPMLNEAREENDDGR